MIAIILHIILGVLLLVSFYQDWKYRAISWTVFPLLGMSTLLLFYQKELPLQLVAINLLFLAIVIGCLFLYVSLKRGQLTNIFKKDFGLGDVLFLMAVTPLFAGKNYILFFITGMLLSGIVHLIFFARKKNARIPLAGYLAIYLIMLKVVDICLYHDLFYTHPF